MLIKKLFLNEVEKISFTKVGAFLCITILFSERLFSFLFNKPHKMDVAFLFLK